MKNLTQNTTNQADQSAEIKTAAPVTPNGYSHLYKCIDSVSRAEIKTDLSQGDMWTIFNFSSEKSTYNEYREYEQLRSNMISGSMIIREEHQSAEIKTAAPVAATKKEMIKAVKVFTDADEFYQSEELAEAVTLGGAYAKSELDRYIKTAKKFPFICAYIVETDPETNYGQAFDVYRVYKQRDNDLRSMRKASAISTIHNGGSRVIEFLSDGFIKTDLVIPVSKLREESFKMPSRYALYR